MGDGTLALTKHHGAGNDFLVLVDPGARRPLSAAEARALCDRHRGVGADGIMRATVPGPGSAAALVMELRNADGSVAEMSGNGIRCFVQAAVAAGIVPPGEVVVATAAGLRTVDYRAGDEPGLAHAGVDMGPAVLGASLPVADLPGTHQARTVDMGNPHVVLLGEPVRDEVFLDVGPRLAGGFAHGANVEFTWVGPDPGELTMRVWERGVGETLACGTGACAVVAAAHAWGAAGRRARVHSPGGALEVVLGDSGITLTGPTRHVADIAVGETVLAALVAGSRSDDEARTEVAARP